MNGQPQKMKQKLKQKQKLKLIQDQHYSNNTFYTMMSTLQSLTHTFQGQHQNHYDKKMFKSYDKFNYKDKSQQELISQLQLQIMIFKSSMKLWKHQHPQDEWVLPDNFSKKESVRYVQATIRFFKECKNADCSLLAQDILKILDGCHDDLYSDNKDLTVSQSECDNPLDKQQLLGHALKAQQHMDAKLNQTQNVTDKSQLKADINSENKQYQQLINGKTSSQQSLPNRSQQPRTQHLPHQKQNNSSSNEGAQNISVDKQSSKTILQQNQLTQKKESISHNAKSHLPFSQPNQQMLFLLIDRSHADLIEMIHKVTINCSINSQLHYAKQCENYKEMLQVLKKDSDPKSKCKYCLCEVKKNNVNKVYIKISQLMLVWYQQKENKPKYKKIAQSDLKYL